MARERFWLVSVAGGALAAVAIGLPTVMVPSPFFVRMTPVRPLDYAFWLASAALLGPLLATYVAPGAGGAGPRAACALPAAGGGRTTLGGVLALLAVGCPVCNKLVVLALGAGGALTFFAPLQPVLGVASLALLAFTLATRLRALGAPWPARLQRPRRRASPAA
jgi:hypothetical protein